VHVTLARRGESPYYLDKMKNPKRPRDTAEMAQMIVDIATERIPNEKPIPNQAAVRRGLARKEALSPRKRVAIAKKAAAARWGKKKRK
jgi:hypothetical protein